MEEQSIIWVGSDSQLDSGWNELLHKYDLKYCSVKAYVEDPSLKSHYPVKIFGPFDELNLKDIDIKKVISNNEEESTLVVSNNNTINDIIEVSNLESVFRFIHPNISKEELDSIYIDLITRYQIKIERQSLYKNLKEKNLELDSLNLNLKELVKTRTQDLEASRSESGEKANQLKDLVQFISHVSQKPDFESILNFINQEVGQFENMGSPIFIYKINHQAPNILSFQNKSIVSHSCRDHLMLAKIKSSRSEEEFQLCLANELGRPFGKILPITLILNKEIFSGDVGAVLMFEHSMNQKQLNKFMEYITERLQSFSIATEKLLLELDLTQISQLWESTFDGVNNPVAIVDHEFNLLRANRHFYLKIENKDKKCYESFQGRNTICPSCPLDTKDGLQNNSALIQRGESLYQIYSYPLDFDNTNNIKAYVNYYLDVTRSRLLQSKVIQNEKIAAIGHLAGSIAHELNNPLSGIKAMTQIILKELREKDSFYNDVEEVNKAVIRCHKIINNLLDFTKEESSGDEVVSLTHLVTTTLPLLKTILSDHNVEIDLNSDSGNIKASTSLIQQVIFNLIKNACQSIDVGPGVIKILTFKENDYTCFSVEDSGMGMEKKVLDLLYDPFFTTKKEGEGTGLGMFISQNIIEKHGGLIEVDSRAGEGTKFTVKFKMFEGEK